MNWSEVRARQQTISTTHEEAEPSCPLGYTFSQFKTATRNAEEVFDNEEDEQIVEVLLSLGFSKASSERVEGRDENETCAREDHGGRSARRAKWC